MDREKVKPLTPGTCWPEVTSNPVFSSSVSLHVFLLPQWKQQEVQTSPLTLKKIGKRKGISPVCFGRSGTEPETGYWVHTLAISPTTVQCMGSYQSPHLFKVWSVFVKMCVQVHSLLYRPVMNQSKISVMQRETSLNSESLIKLTSTLIHSRAQSSDASLVQLQLFSVSNCIFIVLLRLCLCHWAHRR